MKYVNLGRTGLKVSRICLGMMTYGSPAWREWVLDEAAALPFIRRALELGINFFDTADIYSAGLSEEILGRALNTCNARREEVVIATKVYFPMGRGRNEGGLGRKHIRHAIDASLRRLGTDYVDLYQIHRFDYETPIEETLEALTEVVRAGKALHVGASSMFAWEFARYLYLAERRGCARFATMQNHYNLVYREEEREMLPLCRAEGIGVIPWSPLARGFLAGNRSRDRQATGQTDRARTDDYAARLYYQADDFAVVERVGEIAARRGVSHAQIALAWLLHQPAVSAPIVGASRMAQLEEAVTAVDLELGDDELAALAEPYRPHPVLGHNYGDAMGMRR
ncbi:MAG: aldo/keto reductase [Gammaproteobacteria bacterium]|nr:aldo/keto reductase [Gammaproteobacteria bacterium]